jgi:hypothetical protein
MQTSLPDLPFNSCGVTADTRGSLYSTSVPFPNTDLKQLELWQSFATDIHTAISDAMTNKGIVDGRNLIAGEFFRKRPRIVTCEEDVHEAVNTELHAAVRDVLGELGVEGRFYRPGSGKIGVIGDPDFSWLTVDAGHPKLVVRKTNTTPNIHFC